jgi:hypothetical protein
MVNREELFYPLAEILEKQGINGQVVFFRKTFRSAA